MERLFGIFTVFLMVLGLNGCDTMTSEPYIYDAKEFNREAPNFGQEIHDRDSVSICYSRYGTTPEAVRKMAEAECDRFGKTAVFRSQDFLTCPVTTPARATYLCRDPQAATP